MPFVQDLEIGQNNNIRVTLPSAFAVIEEFPSGVNLEAHELGMTLHVARSISMVDLSDAHFPQLRSDIETVARTDFELLYGQIIKEQGEPSSYPPRTSDPEWSPVIEAKRVLVSGSTALYVIRRLAYQPGIEIIAGQLLLPTENCTYTFTFEAQINPTGLRESMLAAQLPDIEQGLTQAEIDDRKNDGLIPQHPLTQVRKYMDSFGQKGGIPVIIDHPFQPYSGPLSIAHSGSKVTLPSGYVYAPEFSATMSPNFSMVTNMGLPPLVQHRTLGNISIWMIPETQINGADAVTQLRTMAVHSLEAWEKEGATIIKIESSPFSLNPDRVEIQSYAQIEVGGRPSHAVGIWFLGTDGQVFRVDHSAHISIPRERLFDILKELYASWERIPQVPLSSKPKAASEPEAKPKKKWWQFRKK